MYSDSEHFNSTDCICDEEIHKDQTLGGHPISKVGLWTLNIENPEQIIGIGLMKYTSNVNVLYYMMHGHQIKAATDNMSLTKIPFILLVTWGFNASLTPPNPPAPKHECIASKVPIENRKFIYWAPLLFKVRRLFEEYLADRLANQPSDRSHNFFSPLLR